MRAPPESSAASSLALFTLVAIVVAAPWPFGAATPRMRLAFMVVTLAASTAALVLGALRGGVRLPAVPVWPLVGFLGLGLLQLVPLPRPLHRLVAPGSSLVWHPTPPLAAEIVGAGWHPLSLDPDTTLRSVTLVLGLALLSLLAAPALARPATAVRALVPVTAGGFVLSAFAIVARARFGVLLYGRLPVPTISPFGPFVSKNHFACYAGLATLVALGLALALAEGGRGKERDWATSARASGVVLAVVASSGMALAVLASLSRGGVVALCAGILGLLALLWARHGAERRRRVLPAFVTAGALGLVLLAVLPPEAHERLRSLGGASFRVDTWRDTVRMVSSSPLVGLGLGSFHDVFPSWKRGRGLLRVEHAENDYLETLAETGLLGLGFALAGGVLLLARAARAPRGPTERLALGATAGILALGVHSAVDFNLRIPSNAALAGLLAAIVAASAGVRPRSLAPPRCLAMALGTLVLLAAAVRLEEAPWRAARQEASRAAAADPGPARVMRLARAEAALRRTLQRRPAHAESWILLAGVRAAQGQAEEARHLADHARRLDPQRPSLRSAAEKLGSRSVP